MTFSLRFKTNFKEFEDVLDELLYLINTDKQKFKKDFPNIDVKYWDKILDLCENGETRKRNSSDFTRLITKCKTISNEYHGDYSTL